MKLLGISKSKTRNYYVFEKCDKFIECFDKLLSNIGFSELQVHGFFRPDGKPPLNSIKDVVDKHHFFVSDMHHIDLIIGVKKIFVIIYSAADLQTEIFEEVSKFWAFE
ncbi:MAG: hypothetical protein KKC75_03625 [Nanoarchaeota archaeon]|nr:hypothetical protein [Nanoarchaeota archaeon]